MSELPSWCKKLLSGELPVAHCDAHLGLEPVALEVGRAHWRMRVERHHTNVHGGVGGGIVSAALDTALASAGATTLSRDKTAMTVQHTVNLLRPARGDVLDVTGRVVYRGGRLLHVEGEARDEAGEVVARAHQILAVVPRKPAQTKAT